MKIIRLQAENIKRLKAIDITPDGNTVIIAGKNGSGKTSTLDSIWFALGGGPAARGTSKPIRDGETHAQVTLDLGELVVTRTWAEGGKTALRVQSKDGAVYKSPQSMLDALVGRLSFDPLAFAQQDERTQLASLLELVDLPFDTAEMAASRAGLYERRTEIGRAGKRLEGQLAGMPQPDAGLPAEEISVADLLGEHRAARQVVADNRLAREHLQELGQAQIRAIAKVQELEQQLVLAREQVERVDAEIVTTKAHVDALTDPDLDGLEKQLADAETTNARVRLAVQRTGISEELAAAKTDYDGLTAGIAALDTQKADAIAAAKMPIDGLAFDDQGVTYRGMPFKQCSAAEQLRVSLAMAMAMNPRVRIVLIRDGSLLDSDNMRLIEEMATDQDMQIWLERVDESGKVGVVIEDGAVRERVTE